MHPPLVGLIRAGAFADPVVKPGAALQQDRVEVVGQRPAHLCLPAATSHHNSIAVGCWDAEIEATLFSPIVESDRTSDNCVAAIKDRQADIAPTHTVEAEEMEVPVRTGCTRCRPNLKGSNIARAGWSERGHKVDHLDGTSTVPAVAKGVEGKERVRANV